MGSRVLVADDDLMVCRVLKASLQRDEFDVEVVHTGNEALRLLQAEGAPRLALLDWSMPGLDGIEVCRQLRARAGPHTHIILMSGRQNEEDILKGFDAGVDEFIAKPFDLQGLSARLRAAERRLRAEGAHGLQGAMGLLLEAGRGLTGEVVVRSRERVGRVVFHKGKVAWIHLSGGTSLMPLLTGLGMTEHEVRLAFDECHRQRLPFIDTLVSWGLMPREVLYASFRDELASRLQVLLTLPSVEAFFVPDALPFRSGFLYDLAEIEPSPFSLPSSAALSSVPVRLASTPPPPQPLPPVIQALWSSVIQVGGLVSAVILDRRSGQSVLSEGEPCNPSLLRKIARIFFVDVGESFEESLLTSETHYHISRSLSHNHLLYLRIDRKRNPNIGLIRLLLSRSATEPGSPVS